MTNKRSTQVEEKNISDHIGHITTPIARIEEVRSTLESHGVILFQGQTDAKWWTLVLPMGSTRTLKVKDDECSLHTVCLPDGYNFKYLPPTFTGHKNDTYARLPLIIVCINEA